MTSKNKLGIWMDYSEAHLIADESQDSEAAFIYNTFKHENIEYAVIKGEELMCQKIQQHLAAYYKKISDVIAHYKEVILFGPTDAKTELLKILKVDFRFENIKIEVQTSDKMTEYQKQALVQTLFAMQ